MNRPTLEVADIIRQHGKDFIESNRSWLTWAPGSLFPLWPSRHLV